MRHGIPQPVGSRNNKGKVNLSSLISFVAVAVFIFAAGIWVGQGRFSDRTVSQLGEVSQNLPNDLDYSSVEAVYDKLRLGFDGELSETSLLDGLKKGLVQASGDPYTEYFDPTEAQEFNGEINGTFSGIGAELGKDEQGNVIVIAPLSGFPAEKAGLRARDIIIQVDDTPLNNKTVNEAVSIIRGPIGTDVKLKVFRNNNETLDLTITRAQIKVPSVEHEIIDDNIGYLRISRFSDDTVSLSKEAINAFVDAKVRGVILDLRSNPGGLLPASVDVSGFWVDKSQVVLQEKRDGQVLETFHGSANPILLGMKTAVLIDEGSASASEITAAALRDNGLATIIGKKSFGKGSVQQLEQLKGGGLLKVTMAHWFTPSGEGIDGVGITPDKEVDITDEDIASGTDSQKQAAIDFIKQ